jgi:hypothetical protein
MAVDFTMQEAESEKGISPVADETVQIEYANV